MSGDERSRRPLRWPGGSANARVWATVGLCVAGWIWGTNFVFMKWALTEISATQIALLRVLCGLIPVLAFAIVRRDLRLWHLRYAHHFLVMAILASSLYYVAFAAATDRLPSGLAGALSGIVPLFAFAAGAVLLPEERITTRSVIGGLIGAGGVAMIARPWDAHGHIDLVGVGLALVGSALTGSSFAYAKRFLTGAGIPAAAMATYQMALGVVVLLLITNLHGIGAIREDRRALLAVVVGLGLVGTGIAFILYYTIIAEFGASTAVLATYIPPVVALGIGWIGLGEPLGLSDAAALALILAGVMVIRSTRRTPGPELGGAT